MMSTTCLNRGTAGTTPSRPSTIPILEHDFGSIQLGENTIFWKIDYYDLDLHMHSPDPSDETVTARVLTIMLVEEY